MFVGFRKLEAGDKFFEQVQSLPIDGIYKIKIISFKSAEEMLRRIINDDLMSLIIDNIENNRDIKNLIEEYLRLQVDFKRNISLKETEIKGFIDTSISQEIIDTLQNLKDAIKNMGKDIRENKKNKEKIPNSIQRIDEFLAGLKTHIEDNPLSNESFKTFIANLEKSISKLNNLKTEVENSLRAINTKFNEIIDNANNSRENPLLEINEDICKYVVNYFKAKKKLDEYNPDWKSTFKLNSYFYESPSYSKESR